MREDAKNNGGPPSDTDALPVAAAEGRRSVDRRNPQSVRVLFKAARERLVANGNGENGDPLRKRARARNGAPPSTT